MTCGIFYPYVKEIFKNSNAKILSLSPNLHLFPDELAENLKKTLKSIEGKFSKILVVYGRCAPNIDLICESYKAKRIEGEHCGEIIGGWIFYKALREEPGTYFLYPFLSENFKKFFVDELNHKVVKNLFKNYRRIIYFDFGDEAKRKTAREISNYLNLSLEIVKMSEKDVEKRLNLLIQNIL
ncbi:MAG: DUF1638 domain-containing protein [Methanosarcinales archaeon]